MSDREGGSRGVGPSLLRFAAAAVAIAVLGLVAGVLFGRGTPRRAASSVISDLVHAAPTPAPTAADAEALRCGVVVLRYRPTDVDEDGVTTMRAIADDRPGAVLLRETPDLATAVEAAAWGHRMPLGGVNRELLSAFVTAYAGRRTEAEGCPD